MLENDVLSIMEKKYIFINHIVEVISIVRAVQPTYGTNPPIPTDQFNPKIG